MALVLGAVASGCGLPYWGAVTETPSRTIQVTDTHGNPLSDFDLYLFRCTHPGSQLDKVFPYLDQKSSPVVIEEKRVMAWKRAGNAQLAPDFLIASEPEPYWVACVAKPGYQSRRWSLGDSEGEPLTIKLHAGDSPGPDACVTERSECTVCRSYEYFLYRDMRYRHGACAARP